MSFSEARMSTQRCMFTALNQETGRYEHVGTETRIGVSVERAVR